MKRRLLPLAAVLALACGDSVAPQDAFSAFYKLLSVDGIALPTTVSGNPNIPAYKMVADTIFLGPSGHFDDQPWPESGQRIGIQGTWGFRGDSVFFFESTLGELAAKAKVTGSTMTMRTLALHIFPDHDLVYTKIAS